eukprot:scaffold23017_cov120-Isochrysis_galbana.AAC.1
MLIIAFVPYAWTSCLRSTRPTGAGAHRFDQVRFSARHRGAAQGEGLHQSGRAGASWRPQTRALTV